VGIWRRSRGRSLALGYALASAFPIYTALLFSPFLSINSFISSKLVLSLTSYIFITLISFLLKELT
jgi:hypothetical protein